METRKLGMTSPWVTKLLHKRLVQVITLICAAIVVSYYIVLDVPRDWQLLSSLVLLTIAVLIARFRPQYRNFLVLVSCALSIRYIYWRATHTLSFDNFVDASAGLLLFAAEAYGILVLIMGYFQTIREYHRKPVTLPQEVSELPWVDVFIPTYNESVEIVERTVSGALRMDYPKKKVYILDDGRRAPMRRLAKRLGCGYLVRDNNRHAKAGNLNEALKRTTGDLVAIFDADHVPVRSFLQMTVGQFLKDPKMSLVQTPHHFFNPDPFARNLLTEGRVPPEQEFFYHVILLGDDFWNSVFFCGSCAVLRRSSLQEIGGIARETVTEDAHTGLKLHAAGWNSAYIEIPQAAGLATERYSAHVVQRMRWAQGMIQILRVDNPLFKKGLSMAQRVNYLNSMMYFLFGFPRLIYILAPLVFLLAGVHPLRGDPWEIMSYALPAILLAWTTNSLVFRNFRHSFWAEVYETSIAWQSAVITAKAIVAPSKAKFNVTDKGAESLDRATFDWRNAMPNLVLLFLSLLGLVVAPLRALWFPHETSTILLNCGWVCFNLVMLSAALLVALEQVQRRSSFRVDRESEALVEVERGEWIPLDTVNISQEGCRLRGQPSRAIPEWCRIKLAGTQGAEVKLRARLVHRHDAVGASVLGFQFEKLDPRQRQLLSEVVFGPADSWLNFAAPLDNVLRGFIEVLRTPSRVFWALNRHRRMRQHGVR